MKHPAGSASAICARFQECLSLNACLRPIAVIRPMQIYAPQQSPGQAHLTEGAVIATRLRTDSALQSAFDKSLPNLLLACSRNSAGEPVAVSRMWPARLLDGTTTSP